MKILPAILSFTFVIASSTVTAAETLKAYRPGGPAPAMKEAAQAFEKKTGTNVDVVAGQRGTSKPGAKAFIDFLLSAEGAAIFRRWGWKA